MDEYNISQQPSRFQAAHHFQSSLDEPNLDNVEAKLYAIRQRNQEMAQGYFQQKYGVSNAYDQFLQSSNLKGLVDFHMDLPQHNRQEELDLKRHLQEKARQIQRQELSKINRANGKQFTEKKRNSKKINPWSEQKPSKKRQINNQSRHIKIVDTPSNYGGAHHDNQSQDYDHQQPEQSEYDEVINIKQSKQQKKGQFLNEFKQYLFNKNNYKQQADNPSQESPQKQNVLSNTHKQGQNLAQSKMMKSAMGKSKLNQSLGKNESSLNKSNGMMTNNSMVNKSKVQQLTAEEQLVKKIFKTINKGGASDYIEKIELAEYLTNNDRILSVIGTTEGQILEKIQHQLETKDPNKVKFHECLMFIYQLLGKHEEEKKLRAKHCFNDIPTGCMLQPDVVKHFEKAFKALDKNNDMIVKRLAYIEKLALDPVLKKILNMPAVYEPNINKTVSVRRVFERIEVQALLSGEEMNAKQYISWAQFIGYFSSGHTQRSKYDILGLVESLKGQDRFGFGNIPQVVFEVVSQVIHKLDKGEQYFNTKDIVAEILVSNIFQMEKYTFVRGKGQDVKSKDLPMETFEEVLVRIKQTAPQFVSVKEFLEYFSDKGQPREVYEQEVQNRIKKDNEIVKVSKIQKQLFSQEPKDIDGYDSDPEFYNNSNVENRAEFRKTINNPSKLQVASTSLHNQNYSGGFQSQDIIKITVPQPFKFEQRQKQRKQKREQSRLNRSASETKSQALESEFFRFRAKQIPSKVKQVGLFQKMMTENQKKIQDRRKCSMLLTLANQEPFSFYKRKANKKSHQERQNFEFKANPIPWFCSVNLLEKKQEQNINRNQKIARMAQQSLNKAKLPPRMEKDFQEKLAKKALEMTKKEKKDEHIIRAKQPPNFDLLHKKFQNAMERKRKQNKTTEVKQFNFRDAKRQKADRSAMKQVEQVELTQNDPESWKKALKSSINVYASSTLKFDQQVEKRRQEMEDKKKKEQKKRQEEEQRKKVDSQLKKRLQSRSKITEKKQQSALQQRRGQLRKQEQSFKATKAEWAKNAKKQPLLVERPLKRDIKIERMKKLHQISASLKHNGIKGKQHDTYFNKEQLLLLQDYELLKDKL